MKRRLMQAIRMMACLFLTACLISAQWTPVVAVTQAEIDALKEDASGLKSERKELEKKIAAKKITLVACLIVYT